MHRTYKLLAVNLVMSILILGCSSTPLQSQRLNKAETYIIQAEQALTANRKQLATQDMGTAKAYLDTLKDNLKFLTKTEVKRYHNLRAREKNTSAKVGFKAP